jgi:hypothetical protein
VNPLLPTDFWTRLALLDARCTIEVKRLVDEANGARVAVVIARRRDDPARCVVARGDTLRATLARLLAAAEAARLDE